MRNRLFCCIISASMIIGGCSVQKAGGDVNETSGYSFEESQTASEPVGQESTAAIINTQPSETKEEITQVPTSSTYEITTTEEETTQSPNIGLTALAVVPNYVNVRTGPSTDYEIVGKIYNDCAATILDEIEMPDGHWYLMTSGNCTGYIKSVFFIVGEAAEAKREEVGVKKGIVIDDYLRVRNTPSLDTLDNVMDYYRTGTEVVILSVTEDGWAEIQTDEVSTGYVYLSCLNVFTEFKTAITLVEEAEAEARRIAAEEAARKAQEEYEAALAAQIEAERLAAEAAAAAAAAEAAAAAQAAAEEAARIEAERQAAINAKNALRAAIVAYALQFEGCPYVHGGRSLTNGTDCSGFTALVYQAFGYKLSFTPGGQAEQYTRIDASQVQPGDILFYSNSKKYIGHVGIYIGNGKIINAASEQYGICIWDWNYRQPLFAVSVVGP